MEDCSHEPAPHHTRPPLEDEKLKEAQSIELAQQALSCQQQGVEAKAPAKTCGGKEKDNGGR